MVSFFLMTEYNSIMCLYTHIFLFYSSIIVHLGYFHSLVIMNGAAINISVQVAQLYPNFHSFRYISWSSITMSYGSSILSFLRHHHTAFHNGCTNQQCILLHPCQHLLLFVFLMVTTLVSMRLNLSVVLICISFIAKEIEHFFMCLLTICASSFQNSLFNSCAHFFFELLF
jgi:hypothetical protein